MLFGERFDLLGKTVQSKRQEQRVNKQTVQSKRVEFRPWSCKPRPMSCTDE